MSTMQQAKEDAGSIADRVKAEMRNAGDKAREHADKLRDADGAYDYSKITQQVRFVTLIALPIQMFGLYLQRSNVGYLGFALPIALCAANLILVFNRWKNGADGRKDIANLVSSRNAQHKVHHGLQAFGPLIFALLVHLLAPAIPSNISTLAFTLCDYINLLTTGACLGLDAFEGLKNKVR
ncbi:hypothetical protein M3Y99_01908700 [Aphelenchoides fujianensis]|nr:hypothetical protein M3Y99_01908700 [Aphelenchoides fujianensis]